MGDISFKFLGVDFIFTNREIYCWIFLLPLLLLLLSLLLLLLLLLGFDSKNETQLNQKKGPGSLACFWETDSAFREMAPHLHIKENCHLINDPTGILPASPLFPLFPLFLLPTRKWMPCGRLGGGSGDARDAARDADRRIEKNENGSNRKFEAWNPFFSFLFFNSF